MQRRRVSNQPDLFPVNQPEVQRVAIERAKLLPFLRNLLLEVVFGANAERPTKQRSWHHSRGAIVQIHQSSPAQVANNLESKS